MTSTKGFSKEQLPDLSFSTLSEDKEQAMQHVFIQHDHGKPIPPLTQNGTRAQTFVIRSLTTVYFCYRNTVWKFSVFYFFIVFCC